MSDKCNKCGQPLEVGEYFTHGDCLQSAITRTQTLAAEVEAVKSQALQWREESLEIEASALAERDKALAKDVQLTAEVKRLRAELAAMTEAWENQCAARVNDGAALYMQQFALEDEVAALRAQLAAREHAACPHCGQSLHGVQLLPF